MRAKPQAGQATVEYILLLVAAVSFFLLVVQLLRPILTDLNASLRDTIERRFFGSGSFHRPMFPRN